MSALLRVIAAWLRRRSDRKAWATAERVAKLDAELNADIPGYVPLNAAGWRKMIKD